MGLLESIFKVSQNLQNELLGISGVLRRKRGFICMTIKNPSKYKKVARVANIN